MQGRVSKWLDLHKGFDYLKVYDVSVILHDTSFFYTSKLIDKEPDSSKQEHIIQVIPKIIDAGDRIEFSYTCLDHGLITAPEDKGRFISRDQLVTLLDCRSVHDVQYSGTSQTSKIVSINSFTGRSYSYLNTLLKSQQSGVIRAEAENLILKKKDDSKGLQGLCIETVNDYTDFTILVKDVIWEEQDGFFRLTYSKNQLSLNTINSVMGCISSLLDSRYSICKRLKTFYNSKILIMNDCEELPLQIIVRRALLNTIILTENCTKAYYIVFSDVLYKYVVYCYHYDVSNNSVEEAAYTCNTDDYLFLEKIYEWPDAAKRASYAYNGGITLSPDIFKMARILAAPPASISEF